MKPVDLLISMCTVIRLTFMIPLVFFSFLCPALIRLTTDSKSGRPSLKSACTDSVFENINIIQDLTFFANTQGSEARIISSDTRTNFYLC